MSGKVLGKDEGFFQNMTNPVVITFRHKVNHFHLLFNTNYTMFYLFDDFIELNTLEYNVLLIRFNSNYFILVNSIQTIS